jgi:hypothetical protein
MVSDMNRVNKYKGLVATNGLQNDERRRTPTAAAGPVGGRADSNREAVDSDTRNDK